MTERAQDLMRTARKHHIAGTVSLALSVLCTVMKIPDRESAMEATDASIAYIVAGLETPSMPVRRGDAEIIFNALSHGLRVTRERKRVRRILSAIEKVTRKLRAFRVFPSRYSIDRLLQTIYDLMETANDPSILSQSRVTIHAISKSIAASIPIGSRVEFGKSDSGDGPVPSSYILAVHDNQLRDLTLQTPLNRTSSAQVSVSYGSELVSDFSGSWSCEEAKSCQSVVVIYKLYPKKGPFSDDPANYRISPTIDISIHSPVTGSEKFVRGYLSAVSLQITLTAASEEFRSGFETKCQYWDEESQSWRSDGIHLLWQTSGKDAPPYKHDRL